MEYCLSDTQRRVIVERMSLCEQELFLVNNGESLENECKARQQQYHHLQSTAPYVPLIEDRLNC
ncbi:hypothetical protein J6590_094627 [Homalodisca vitripennis]|nr:hypothetical protein J6590_094627 [Homalodisca vitripennis]